MTKQSKLKSRWRRFRPALVVLIALTGVGTPAVTAFLGAADVAVEVLDENQQGGEYGSN